MGLRLWFKVHKAKRQCRQREQRMIERVVELREQGEHFAADRLLQELAEVRKDNDLLSVWDGVESLRPKVRGKI